MKSRTSYFDAAVLKKNITRFAPAWGIYCAFLLMLFMITLDMDAQGVYMAGNLAETIAIMVVVNCIYGFVTAQLLWGDLFNSRMCNALHALPLRREGWFVTGTAAGLLFSLVPNLVFALGAMAFCGDLWPVALLWLAAVTLQYLCFFGLATLSALLVGNRFAMGLVYGIFNFISMIFYWLLDALYLPSLRGIVLRQEHFTLFSPVVQMAMNNEQVLVEWTNENGIIRDAFFSAGEGWGYAGICAGLGAAALVLALLLYRKRHLECAGDLVAVKPVGPVVLVLYTLCITAICYGFLSLFMGTVAQGYCLIGLFIGFFTGRMLLERQVRVFRKKNLLAFCAVVALFFGSIIMAEFDLLGIANWMPDKDKVAAVQVSTGGSYYYQENGITLEAPEDIEKILYVHKEGLEKQGWNGNGDTVRLYLTYEMESGMRRSRQYSIYVPSEAGQILKTYLSSREAVLGELDMAGALTSVNLYDPGVEISDPQALAALLDAIRADCDAGNMAQDRGFYPDSNVCYMSLQFITPDGIHYFTELRFWDGCENIMAWVEEHSIEFEKYE